MDQILSIVRVKGHVPRRAVVLADGGLADKTSHPDCAELELLSRVCEVARASCGAPCYPRQTAALLERALADNDVGAWQAVRDDLVTGDLDAEVTCAVLSQGSNASALVACLIGARSAKHLLHVSCLMARALEDPEFREETRAEMGRALACQMRPLLDTLVAHGASMPLDTRDAAYDGLGRVVAMAVLPDARVADAVLHVLERRREELLRLFLRVPASFVDHRPQILPALLGRLSSSVSATSRYPALELLARVLEHEPGAAAGAEQMLPGVLAACLKQRAKTGLDSRECLAASRIVAALGASRLESPQQLCEALAAGLRQTSVALIRAAEPGVL